MGTVLMSLFCFASATLHVYVETQETGNKNKQSCACVSLYGSLQSKIKVTHAIKVLVSMYQYHCAFIDLNVVCTALLVL